MLMWIFTIWSFPQIYIYIFSNANVDLHYLIFPQIYIYIFSAMLMWIFTIWSFPRIFSNANVDLLKQWLLFATLQWSPVWWTAPQIVDSHTCSSDCGLVHSHPSSSCGQLLRLWTRTLAPQFQLRTAPQIVDSYTCSPVPAAWTL